MKKSEKIKRISIGFVASVFTAAYISPIGVVLAQPDNTKTDGNSAVSSAEVASALAKTSGVLEASDQIATSSDHDSSLKTNNQNIAIDVPKDASNGVTLDSVNSPAIEISLPNAEQAADAKKIASGVVAYEGKDGSASAVQATESGAVRMLTVIDNFNAPTQYDYKVTIPNGGRIELAQDGGAKVLDASNQTIVLVDKPWAKDGAGKNIKTFFTTDGQSLTQHVNHRVAGTVYPVTADPIWFAVSAAVFWWAVQRCAAGGIVGAVFEYVGGSRSRRAIAAAGAAGCIASFVGGWGILKNMVRIIRW